MSTIYDEIKNDHRTLEKLMDALTETHGESEERAALFEEFRKLLEVHSHAEERAFYAAILPSADAREKTAHGMKEHCEAAELLDELEHLSQGSGGWLPKMRKLREAVRHHIKEEEQEVFAKARKVLPAKTAEQIAKRFLDFKQDES
ncbi:MAG: hemerythrin domain-containing protein [Polyangiaceae bacterium]|nr:hemerythrin domain-containing protein [Myxococcales bacterium]MCB9585804.1 hemerythrin domain-containing protein [Polyangiaceae bacterium]MCB9607267.1 hemerythrin domain-containing protein [Polyangiaceae bacterium]